MKSEQGYWEIRIGLACAFWYALTSFLWTYLANVFISFPIGLIALILWRKAAKKNANSRVRKITEYILIVGTAISLVSLAAFLIAN